MRANFLTRFGGTDEPSFACDRASLPGTEEIIFDPGQPNAILPTHRLSGLPLPILPIEPRHANVQSWKDFDHSYYVESSPELQGIDGLAVLSSRGQDMQRWLHQRKHKVFPDGPVLPKTRDEKLTACVLACCDFMPRQAIDLTPDGSYNIVEMSDAQIDSMVRSRSVHIENANHVNHGSYYRARIGMFFAFHTVEQDMSHISSGVADEFLYTTDRTRRKELGNLIIEESVELVVEPVRRLVPDLLSQGIVQLRPRDPYMTVRKFFVKSRFPDYYGLLGESLKKVA